MALFMLKPILWNSLQYTRPSGTRASKSSFPGKTGFGHEEWNNSPRLQFTERDGSQYRVFHTEAVGRAPVEENGGLTFVFMIASHNGVQDLVGVAGNAIFLGNESRKQDRQRLAKRLNLRDLWKDAWALPLVQDRYEGQLDRFKAEWPPGTRWLPNWICPAEFYWWPDTPIRLDAQRLIGKKRLPSMFTAYQAIDLNLARSVMETVPLSQRKEAWKRLVDAMQLAPSAPPSLVDGSRGTPVTSQLRLAHARCGQGKFREDLMGRWDGACAVTRIDQHEVLRASHVKPWASSTDVERLDAHNGLLLSANLDALFDVGLISFDDEGEMLVAGDVPQASKEALGLPAPLQKTPTQKLREYLDHHRRYVFRQVSSGAP